MGWRVSLARRSPASSNSLAMSSPTSKPLARRSLSEYSGKFQVRIPPATHRRIAEKAAEEHVSLHRYVSDRLASA
ncbi:toxin-antitoxin system HicB family antitoxin [Isoptericola croceus]|uniref:toxin-antitoxin system HicB family antitoxin n=1 Tax=Isoptericola croceus TaxID=3031406 RepID=UPI0034D5D416